jgi:hypothetical protein
MVIWLFCVDTFGTGANKSFISERISCLIKANLSPLDAKYFIELANRNLIKDCKLGLPGHKLEIDLMPISIGSFDVIVGMDCLSKNQAEISVTTRLFALLSGGFLLVKGERTVIVSSIMSFLKAQKCLRKGHAVILAVLSEKPSEIKKIEDIPIVHDFPKVFPEDLWVFHLIGKLSS